MPVSETGPVLLYDVSTGTPSPLVPIQAPLSEFVVPEKRFSHINIDLVGPLRPSSGFSYLLTIVERTTRWPEAIPLCDTTTLTCVQALIAVWISRFGVPLDMSSDRGSQFTYPIWSLIAQLLGLHLHVSKRIMSFL